MDSTSYALSKKYVNNTLVGTGALKGSPCTVKSYTEVLDGTQITFEWEKTDGTKQTSNVLVKKGIQGYSIANVEIRTVQGPAEMENHLIITLDDDLSTELDAGIMPTIQSLIYEEDIATASDTWIAQHNLKEQWYNLSITCLDNDSNIVIGEVDVLNTTDNLLVVKFNEPITGKIIVKK